MRVVIDTNVLVSSFFGGNPRRMINLWKRGKIVLCLSPGILEEYVEVLERMGVDSADLEALLALFAAGPHVLFTASTPSLTVVAEDPDDDKFIECAVALKAEAIVTGDKALAAVRSYMGIQVCTPKQFLERWT